MLRAVPRPSDWTPVLAADDLPQGKAIRVTAEGVDILLYSKEGGILAIANRCSHQGGPLHRGSVNASVSPLTVTCPVHGSVFMLEDGRVVRGPAVVAQQVFETRVNGDQIEVRARPA
jgi:nitrite reductase/ring-hydroxylating ferredoxin subunit